MKKKGSVYVQFGIKIDLANYEFLQNFSKKKLKIKCHD